MPCACARIPTSSRSITTFKSEANHGEKTKARSCERAFCYGIGFRIIELCGTRRRPLRLRHASERHRHAT